MAMSPGTGDVARGEAIAAGLVVDGVPESIALGLTVAEGEVALALLAGILVGNTVEGYGAAQPMIAEVSRLVATVTVLGFVGGYLLS
jgi:zinc transporter, ZIP family